MTDPWAKVDEIIADVIGRSKYDMAAVDEDLVRALVAAGIEAAAQECEARSYLKSADACRSLLPPAEGGG